MKTRAFLALCLGLSLAGPSLLHAESREGQEGGFRWRMSSMPGKAVVGTNLILDFRIEGLASAELERLSLSSGFALESSLIKPSGDGNGSLIMLELRVGHDGPWLIKALDLVGRQGPFRLKDLDFGELLPPAGGKAASTWEWSSPDRVYRYAAFAVSMKGPREGLSSASPPFQAPKGLVMERLPGEPLSWTAAALEQGGILLPETLVDSGTAGGKAPSRRIEVLALPPALAATRAQGRFSLEAAGPDNPSPRVGDLLVFRFRLVGLGNQPYLRFPLPEASIDGHQLGQEAWTQRRVDEVKPVPGAYEGEAVLEVSLQARAAGLLRLGLAPMAVLEPGGNLVHLNVPAFEISVGKLPSGAAAARDLDPFMNTALLLASGLAEKHADGKTLEALVKAGKPGEALKFLRSHPSLGGRAGPAGTVSALAPPPLLELSLLWESGSRAEALAGLYGQARRKGSDAELRALANAASDLVAAGPRLADSLPPPRPFLIVGTCLLACGAALAAAACLRDPSRRARFAAWRFPRSGPPKASELSPHRRLALEKRPRHLERRRRLASPGFVAASSLALLGAFAAFGLALAAGLERKAVFAVAWADKSYAVPSPLAENSSSIKKGQCARVVGSAEGYVCLRFQDGSVGWLAADGVYLY